VAILPSGAMIENHQFGARRGMPASPTAGGFPLVPTNRMCRNDAGWERNSGESAGEGLTHRVGVAKISCKQYLTGNLVRQDYLTLWLSGYVNGTRSDTVIETGTVQNVANKVGTFCRSNLDAGLMEAVEKVLGEEKK
jgi:hypothetical protein